MTGVYATAHMLVDLACAYLVSACVIGKQDWYLWVLVYNFCAFALQMPIGAGADRLNRNSFVAAAGCLGVLAGLILGIGGGQPAAACILAGTGNACFHVGGGIDVLNHSGKRAAPLGIFVAPGALGIFLGSLLGRAPDRPAGSTAVLIGISLILSMAVIRCRARSCKIWKCSGNAPVSYDGIPLRHMLAALCFFGAVILRSYSGMVQDFPWKGNTAGSAWLLAGAVVSGKIAGGFLSDKTGIQTAAFRSMSAAAVGFLCLDSPAAAILAVFCWNMSMPMTLWSVSQVFPGAKGFSFGLLTFGLFIGFCPVYLEGFGGNAQRGLNSGAASSPVGMALMAVMSLLLLGWGLRQVKQT